MRGRGQIANRNWSWHFVDRAIDGRLHRRSVFGFYVDINSHLHRSPVIFKLQEKGVAVVGELGGEDVDLVLAFLGWVRQFVLLGTVILRPAILPALHGI